MTPKPHKGVGSSLVARTEPEIEWRDYARIEPGIYPAFCAWAKSYRDPAFRRWTCLLRFDVLTDDLTCFVACIPLWLNLSTGEKPRAGRRSRYFTEWVRANGAAPKRTDRLSPQVFVRRMARVEIDDTTGDVPYSVVRKIVAWETGHSVNKSHSQGQHWLDAAGKGSYRQ